LILDFHKQHLNVEVRLIVKRPFIERFRCRQCTVSCWL